MALARGLLALIAFLLVSGVAALAAGLIWYDRADAVIVTEIFVTQSVLQTAMAYESPTPLPSETPTAVPTPTVDPTATPTPEPESAQFRDPEIVILLNELSDYFNITGDGQSIVERLEPLIPEMSYALDRGQAYWLLAGAYGQSYLNNPTQYLRARDQAISEFLSVIEAGPDPLTLATAYNLLIKAYLSTDLGPTVYLYEQEAMASLTEMLREEPEPALALDVYLILMDAFEAGGSLDTRDRAIESFLALATEYAAADGDMSYQAGVLNLLGKLHMDRFDYQLAAEYYARLALLDNSPEVLLNAAIAYGSANNLSCSYKYAVQLVALPPSQLDPEDQVLAGYLLTSALDYYDGVVPECP
ncbi:MAG: hypothetical protein EPO32_05255 [Anaerolineae bacterium]|nr:MAG: hypothetical protein EPO32_05255 [Anaerolineae bacterium]